VGVLISVQVCLWVASPPAPWPLWPEPLWPVRDSPKSVRVGAPKGRPGEVGEASGPFVAKGQSGEGPLAHRWPVPHPLPPSRSVGVGGEGRSASRWGVGGTEGEAGKLRGRGGQSVGEGAWEASGEGEAGALRWPVGGASWGPVGSVGGGRGMGAPKGVWLARATSDRHP